MLGQASLRTQQSDQPQQSGQPPQSGQLEESGQQSSLSLRLTRRTALRLGGLAAVSGLSACGARSGTAASVKPTTLLAPFDPRGPRGAPSPLAHRIAWANTSDTAIFVSLGDGIQAAAAERGWEYVTADCNGDPQVNVDQLETFLAQGVGSLVVQPLVQPAQSPPMQAALDRGVCVQGIITWPSTVQVAGRQYEIGFAQGKAAADYVHAHLGGRAEVCYIVQPTISPQLALRRRGTLAGLAVGGSGIRVVDIADAPAGTSVAEGYAAMLPVIEAHPEAKVILGEDDGYVVGAYRALEATGKLTGDMYLSGVDGDANALELIRQGTPYRASFAFPWRLMGYAMGQVAADWAEGAPAPRAMVALAPACDSTASVDAYLADMADAEAVYADPRRLGSYLQLRGNVSYAARSDVWRTGYTP